MLTQEEACHLAEICINILNTSISSYTATFNPRSVFLGTLVKSLYLYLETYSYNQIIYWFYYDFIKFLDSSLEQNFEIIGALLLSTTMTLHAPAETTT